MVGVTGIEPVTPSMSTKCSPTELHALCDRSPATKRSYIGIARPAQALPRQVLRNSMADAFSACIRPR